MEQYAVRRWPGTFQHFYRGNLSRGETDNGSFFVIVRLTAIGNISSFCIFQEQGIYSIIDFKMFRPYGCF